MLSYEECYISKNLEFKKTTKQNKTKQQQKNNPKNNRKEIKLL